MLERTELVVDFARYTPLVNPQELLDGGVRLAIIKADNCFIDNAKRCNDAGLPICAYHWSDPIWDAQRQVDQTMELISKVDHLGVMVDFEHWWASWAEWYKAIIGELAWSAVARISPATISSHTANVFTMFERETFTFGYSSKNFMDSYAANYYNSWINNYEWVMAHYGYQPTQPITIDWDTLKANWLPNYVPLRPAILDEDGIDNVIGHQFTGDRFMLPGMYADSTETKRAKSDVNVFNKSWLDTLLEGFDTPNISPPPDDIPPVIPPVDDDTVYYKYEGIVKTYSLRLRTHPTTVSEIIGGLVADDKIEASEYYEDGVDVWLRVVMVNGEYVDGWVAAYYNGEVLISYNEKEGIIPPEQVVIASPSVTLTINFDGSNQVVTIEE